MLSLPTRTQNLILGTPGTGKTTLSNELGERLSMNVINISEFARENGMLLEYDEELDTMVLDEDQVLGEEEEGSLWDYKLLIVESFC